MSRGRISYNGSRRLFQRTAGKVNVKNLMSYRGGTRF